MEVLRALSSFLSYVFHGLLCLILFVVSGLVIASGAHNLHLSMLPWTGSTLEYTLFFGSLAGLVTVLLAINGRLRLLFFVWSLLVAVVLVKSYIFSAYRFGPGEFGTAMWLIAGSLVALLGSWMRMGSRMDRR